jgi:hypothetical protein
MPGPTSSIAAAIAVEGLLLQLGNGASPQVYNTICNVEDWSLPMKADTVEVTNVGDEFKRRISTLLDLGPAKFNIFWVMRETTHQNSIQSGITGLKYMWRHRILGAFQAVYPDAGQSVDQFLAYVTNYSETGKVGGVFKAEIELSANDPAPLLV